MHRSLEQDVGAPRWGKMKSLFRNWYRLALRMLGKAQPKAACHASAFSAAEANSARHDSCPVRNAGPAAMRDPPQRWERIDEAADESFPASDPSAGY